MSEGQAALGLYFTKKLPEERLSLLRGENIFYDLCERQSKNTLFNCAIHKVLIAEGVGEEAFNAIINHVKVGVEVERNYATC